MSRGRKIRAMPAIAERLRLYLTNDTLDLYYPEGKATKDFFNMNLICDSMGINRTQYQRFIAGEGSLREEQVRALHDFFLILGDSTNEL